MDLPKELELFHQPVRLRIMGLLFQHRDVAFTRVRELLNLTDGNLASHGKRLAEAGFVEMRRVLTPDGFASRLRITRAGARAFRDYIAYLRAFIEAHDADEADSPGEAGSGARPGSAGPARRGRSPSAG